MLLVDVLYYKPQIVDVAYDTGLPTQAAYNDYQLKAQINIALFATSIGLLGLGAAVLIAGIPMLVVKPKGSKVSFHVGYDYGVSFSMVMRL